MRNLAIIPARSGSKGLPDKNIKPLNGKPLIAYSIEQAILSKCFDEIMVSTDSEEYAAIGIEYGASVPFLRSPETSSDTASSWDAVREVINNYAQKNRTFDTFCLLQPTSPLRTSEDIKKAYEEYTNKNALAVISVCKMEHSPLWCNTLPDDGSLSGFQKEASGLRRQDLETYYRLNGAIYIADIKEFLNNSFLYRNGSYAYIMPSEHSIDIDTENDFKLAEFLMKGNL
jgi:CMP-N,N'-diacetyllegionaminic acid synthase